MFSDRSLGPLQGTLAQSAQRSLAHRPATPGIALVRAFGFTAHPLCSQSETAVPGWRLVLPTALRAHGLLPDTKEYVLWSKA